MATDSKNLVWIDMEMSGLDPERDVILEIATVITDTQLNVKESLPAMTIRRDQALFATMDDWNKEHHTKSGLWKEVTSSTTTEEFAEKTTLDFIKRFSKPKESPLCGNSIWQDRRFLIRYMKSIDEFLHYRLVDVSSVKELVGYWYPDFKRPATKASAHRAMDDILESIEELKFYKERYFKTLPLT